MVIGVSRGEQEREPRMGRDLKIRCEDLAHSFASLQASERCEQGGASTASLVLFDQAESLEDTATRLAEMAATLRGRARLPAIERGPDFSLLERAKSDYRARRLRAEILGDLHLATGPAWDILLDMYVCHELGRATSISDAAIAASCPPTTGLRWVNALCAAGLIAKVPDINDQRRTFLQLTGSGLDRVKQALRLH